MAHQDQIATVFGGTGFLGRQIVRELAAKGYRVKVATRVPERAYFLRPCGNVGQVVPFVVDYSDPHSVREAVRGADYVVNCIGLLFERGKKNRFERLHVDVPAMIAKACSDEGVERFVHISALGCDKGTSKYAKSKLSGEKAVLSNFSRATILRPSVIFGEDDDFFNKFAEMARYIPVLPAIGGGKTKFQPVYVGDVADAVMKIFATEGSAYFGKVYQLGGPEVLDLCEVYARIERYTGRHRPAVTLPFCVAKFEAFFLQLLPSPVLTVDQVESLKTDSVVENSALGFKNFDIVPQSMEAILPSYLNRYCVGGKGISKDVAA